MYKSLVPIEREYLLKQLIVYLNIADSNIKKNSDFFIKVKQDKVYEENVLEGTIIMYDNFLVIRNFNPLSHSTIANLPALFEVVVYESIKKLINFSKLYKHSDLRIFSSDAIVIDQLFEHKAYLERVSSAGNPEVFAKLRI